MASGTNNTSSTYNIHECSECTIFLNWVLRWYPISLIVRFHESGNALWLANILQDGLKRWCDSGLTMKPMNYVWWLIDFVLVIIIIVVYSTESYVVVFSLMLCDLMLCDTISYVQREIWNTLMWREQNTIYIQQTIRIQNQRTYEIQ